MEDVRHLLRQLDPEGVDMRSTSRLQRRDYYAKGPNFIWHVHGYDKLKPYGICIHGYIDGYSRKIIWLNSYHSNNNPRVIGGYFLEAVRECGGCSVMVRGDYGTENGHIRDFMRFLSRNVTEGNATMQYLDGALVQFCFTALIQDELDTMANVWNLHSIRRSRNPNCPSGKPQLMYSMPSLWAAEDQKLPIKEFRFGIHKNISPDNTVLSEEQDLRDFSREVQFRTTVPCDPGIYDMCLNIRLV